MFSDLCRLNRIAKVVKLCYNKISTQLIMSTFFSNIRQTFYYFRSRLKKNLSRLLIFSYAFMLYTLNTVHLSFSAG